MKQMDFFSECFLLTQSQQLRHDGRNCEETDLSCSVLFNLQQIYIY